MKQLSHSASSVPQSIDANPSPPSTAGKFNVVYAVGASGLEEQYTEGRSGDVIRRVGGGAVTLLGSTLFLNTSNTYAYEVSPTQLLLGPGGAVTAERLNGLNSSSVAVRQRVSARGVYSVLVDGTVRLDARPAPPRQYRFGASAGDPWSPPPPPR